MTASAAQPRFDSAALLIIDTQQDMLDGGAFPVPGTSAAIPVMQRVLRLYRAAQLPIVHVVRIYERDGSNAELCRRELLAGGAEMLVRDSPGVQIAPELLPDAAAPLNSELLLSGKMQPLGRNEVAMYKPRWGAFYGTGLEQHLRSHGVTTVVFMGCNFPNCPRTSIYEASERDFRVAIVRDAISGLYPQGVDELVGIGVRMVDADQLAMALRGPATVIDPDTAAR